MLINVFLSFLRTSRLGTLTFFKYSLNIWRLFEWINYKIRRIFKRYAREEEKFQLSLLFFFILINMVFKIETVYANLKIILLVYIVFDYQIKFWFLIRKYVNFNSSKTVLKLLVVSYVIKLRNFIEKYKCILFSMIAGSVQY